MLSALTLLVILRFAFSLVRSRRFVRRFRILGLMIATLCGVPEVALAQERPLPNTPAMTEQTGSRPAADFGLPLVGSPEKWTSPEGLSSTIEMGLLLAVLSLAPAVTLMTTCFIRIAVVLGLLRQALGSQNLPPSQVMTSLALFLTLLIMWPVWKQSYDKAIVPYTQKQGITLDEAWQRGTKPIRKFMSDQIDRCGNGADVRLFCKYLPAGSMEPQNYDDVPLVALVPAYMLSELKTAFLIGFQVYLPFVILDLVIASVTIGMGMLMLPPVIISLPFKLLLFVLVDGWHLVVKMLFDSFQPFT
jgi:flagellar biosynthesis protein FliP